MSETEGDRMRAVSSLPPDEITRAVFTYLDEGKNEGSSCHFLTMLFQWHLWHHRGPIPEQDITGLILGQLKI